MGGGKGGGGQQVTVGYWYGLGAHLALCHGPVDEVQKIIVGERVAWSGSVTNNATIFINRLDLFGGEAREGGVQGNVDVMMGGPTQGPNSYLQSLLGQNIPAFRGILSLVLRSVWVAANNPYIKPWSVRAKRIPRQWYSSKAEINGDANPAHIIRECLTDSEWGMGYPESDIDNLSFVQAADTLYAEGFGLSLLWSKETTIEDFILSILRHIDGMLYVHPRTGLFTLRLVRDDYDINTLPIFGPHNITRIEEFSRPSWGETINQVTVVYRDGETDKDTSVTVQDIASVALNGGIVATTINYPGISRGDLANRVAMRELKQLSTNLAKCTFISNRQASNLNIGDVIKLSWPPYGIDQIVMRVVRISYGELANSAVSVECVEDVFGLPQSVYSDPLPPQWVNPTNYPAPCPYQMLYETPYWSIVQDITGDSDVFIGEIGDLDGIVAACGARPTADAFSFDVLAKLSSLSSYENKGIGYFTPTAIITEALPQSIAQITVPIADGIDLNNVRTGKLALVENEFVQVVAIDMANNTVTLERGLLDTVPTIHPANSRIWFVDGWRHYIFPEYVAGETVHVKLLPRTSQGVLSELAAAKMQLTLNKRFIRPYCPGNVRINGQSYPIVVAGEINVSWATRNRKTQTAYLVLQSEGPITPEAGQTTTIQFYNELGNLVRTVAGLPDNSYTWTLEQETIDSGLGRPNDHLRIEIWAERDGHTSWQKQVIEFDRTGYGLRWGQYYGGV